MRFRDLALLFVLAGLLCTSVFTQTQPSAVDTDKAKQDAEAKEKKKKELDERVQRMVDTAIADAGGLRLPGNRAVVYALSGDLYWKFDQKRSRELFRNAAAELLTLNQDSEREARESTDPYNYSVLSTEIRNQVLPVIAQRDAPLALELLVQTRPAALAAALQKASQPNTKTSPGIYGGYDPEVQGVQVEISMEQQFLVMAADQDPDAAIKAIKESLAKGVSYSVLQLLQKLNRLDEKKAADLAGDVIRKLVDTDLAQKDGDMQTALMFLNFANQPARPNTVTTVSTPFSTSVSTSAAQTKLFKFTDSQVKDLANKIVDSLMQAQKTQALMNMISRATAILEKIVPERVAALKQRQAEYQNSLPVDMRNQQQRQKLYDPASTPEDILAQIPRMTSAMDKTAAYQAVSQKISQIADEDRARKLIDQIGDEKIRANAQEQFDSMKISRAAAAGKLDDARKLIGSLTKKSTQIQQLVSLAMRFQTQFQKSGSEKDGETARSLMQDAKILLNEPAENEEDMAGLMQVLGGYATIEPDTAFRIFEPVMDQINEVVNASAVLSKYNTRTREFKKGELVMRMNGMYGGGDTTLLYRFISHMQMLGKADLERMNQLSDRLTRSDARSLVKLFVLQGFMREDRKPNVSTGAGIGAGSVPVIVRN